MDNQQPATKAPIKTQPDTGQRAPIDNDLHLIDDDAQVSNPADLKGQTGRGRLAPQPTLPDLMEGAHRDLDEDEDGAQRNAGRPGDAPEEKRGTGTRTGGSPQSGIKPGAPRPISGE